MDGADFVHAIRAVIGFLSGRNGRRLCCAQRSAGKRQSSIFRECIVRSQTAMTGRSRPTAMG